MIQAFLRLLALSATVASVLSPLTFGAGTHLYSMQSANAPASQAVRSEVAASKVAPDFGWSPGQMLPNLELPRIDGRGPMQLSSLRGKRVILIHFASW